MTASGLGAREVEHLLAEKQRRRQELAQLTVERKYEILLLLQRRENEIRQETGRPRKPEWPSLGSGLVIRLSGVR